MHQDFKGGMRPNQNKRSRGRGHNPNHMGGGGGHQNNNRGPRPPNLNQTFDSNGPSVKIRGNAYQVFERYIALAREASSSGDRISAENLYQHAEHYFRIMQANGEGNPMAPRPMTPADTEMNGMEMDGEFAAPQPMQPQPQQPHLQQPQPQPQPQPQDLPPTDESEG